MKSYLSFLFWRTCSDCWHISEYDEKHCFESRPYGKIFPVRLCTTPVLPSCSFFLGEGVSLSLVAVRRTDALTPRTSDLVPQDILLLLGFFLEETFRRGKVQNVNESWQNHQNSWAYYKWNACLCMVRNCVSTLKCVVPILVAILRSADYIRSPKRRAVGLDNKGEFQVDLDWDSSNSY